MISRCSNAQGLSYLNTLLEKCNACRSYVRLGVANIITLNQGTSIIYCHTFEYGHALLQCLNNCYYLNNCYLDYVVTGVALMLNTCTYLCFALCIIESY